MKYRKIQIDFSGIFSFQQLLPDWRFVPDNFEAELSNDAFLMNLLFKSKIAALTGFYNEKLFAD